MIQYSKCFLIVQLNPQVEPNTRKIEEHRRKYERLRKERELKKAELERKQQAEAQVSVFFFFFFKFFTNNCSFCIHWEEKHLVFLVHLYLSLVGKFLFMMHDAPIYDGSKVLVEMITATLECFWVKL
jgi:hypothetical protein